MNITNGSSVDNSLVPLASLGREVTLIGAIGYTIVTIPGTFMNIIVVYVIIVTKRFHTIPNWLILAMSVTDLVNFIGIRPFQSLMEYTHGWPMDYESCTFLAFFGSYIFAINLANLCFMSINRYVLIAHSALYPKVGMLEVFQR